MAGKPKNRLELRRQYEAAEPLDPMEDESDDVLEVDDEEEAERKPKKKKAAKPKATKATKSSKAAKPAARMRIVWAVVNDAFKTIATFEYSQKEAAEARAAELTAKGKGTHFVQRVKEAMPDDAPGLGASIPRTAPEPAAKAPAARRPVVEDEEEHEDEDIDADNDEDEDEDDED